MTDVLEFHTALSQYLDFLQNCANYFVKIVQNSMQHNI